MKFKPFQTTLLTLAVALVAVSPVFAAASLTTAQQDRLTVIKTRGDQEISRRLSELSKLTAVINNATKLTASDKSALSSEISGAVSGLTALKTTLDNETTLDAARTDAQSILTEYRVFALVMPKVHLLKIADDQVAAATKLSDAAIKLQTRLKSLKTSGKDVTALQATLDDMTTNIASAQKISSTIQSSISSLQPTDYNSNHSVLVGDNAQLKASHASLVKARQDAQTVLEGIKSL